MYSPDPPLHSILTSLLNSIWCSSFHSLSPSCPLNCPHLPLFCLEIVISCWTTMQSLPRLLASQSVFCVVVTCTDTHVTAFVRICLVTNIKIMSTSKCWAITLIIANCFLWFLQSELVVVSQWKNKRLFRIVCCVCPILSAAPFQGSVTSDLSIKLCPRHCQSVANPIALLMELLCTKPIVTGSVQQLYLSDGFCKELSDCEFLFRWTDNSGKFHKLSFFSETLGDRLSDQLIKLRSQLGKLRS